MPAKLNQEQVIARFREVHGDWYDYSQVVYTNAHGKITIICPEHGPFQQPAHGHWQGNGCRACGYLTVGDTLRMSADEAKNVLVKKFGLRAILDLDRYTSASKVRVMCVTHGWISGTLYNLNTYGCSKCKAEMCNYRRKQPITFEELQEHVTPDMETGRIYHRIPDRNFKAGDEYVYQEDRRGYLRTNVNRRNIAVHRVILAFKYGRMIPKEMACDHINGVPWDNRAVNVREVEWAENSINRALNVSSKTSVMGVHYCNTKNKYIAKIRVGGVNVYLGSFDNIEAAAAARKAAEPTYGCHPNHGKTREERAKTT